MLPRRVVLSAVREYNRSLEAGWREPAKNPRTLERQIQKLEAKRDRILDDVAASLTITPTTLRPQRTSARPRVAVLTPLTSAMMILPRGMDTRTAL